MMRMFDGSDNQANIDDDDDDDNDFGDDDDYDDDDFDDDDNDDDDDDDEDLICQLESLPSLPRQHENRTVAPSGNT